MAITSKCFYKDVLETYVPIPPESNMRISWKAYKVVSDYSSGWKRAELKCNNLSSG